MRRRFMRFTMQTRSFEIFIGIPIGVLLEPENHFVWDNDPSNFVL